VSDSAVPFVSLHTHSDNSILDGASKIRDLVTKAKACGQAALAITDHGTLSGAIELYDEATKAGIKPILGCELYVARRKRQDRFTRAKSVDGSPPGKDYFHLIALARNEAGWQNLIQLSSLAYLESPGPYHRVDHELLGAHADGLQLLSACLGGEVAQAILRHDLEGARRIAGMYRDMVGPENYAFELQNHQQADDVVVNQALLELGRSMGIPVVATNDSHFTQEGDAAAHDLLCALQVGSTLNNPDRFRFHGTGYWMPTAEEMLARFPECPEAVAESARIAERCELTLQLGVAQTPEFPLPPGVTLDEQLALQADAGMRRRYPGAALTETHRERLAYELDVIRQTGFPGYFLITADFVQAARDRGVKVGPGRGSAAGSLVAYALGITDIDPIRFGLLFERFLNPERVQMPDIDVDFDDERRHLAIEYVVEKYGADHVAQVITFGTMGAKAAIRDVGRVMEIPIPDVDRLAKTVPARVGVTLGKALSESQDLAAAYQDEAWVKPVVDAARRLEGVIRQASTHASAVVISTLPVMATVPVRRPIKDKEREAGPEEEVLGLLTQFDGDAVARCGLLKMDFLGLESLSVLRRCEEAVERRRGVRIDERTLPLDDPATYAALRRGDTYGVFQLEGSFARRILIEMQPQGIWDLAATSALNRPGPIEGGVPEMYLDRKKGRKPVDYMGLDEFLEPLLRDTYGLMVYQDQVMRVARAVAGYSMGQADNLRSAMGKKNPEKMAKEHERFMAGAAARGIDPEKAQRLFDLAALFAGYGFNEAHALGYAVVGYQEAYLKTHYPLEFMAALLNLRGTQKDSTTKERKVAACIIDCRLHGLQVLPPSINRSPSDFEAVDGSVTEIHYGLRHIKDVGSGDAEALVRAREEGGPFVSLLDVAARAPGVNRRALEALIQAGACDELGERAEMLHTLDLAMRRGRQINDDRESGQGSLFEDLASPGGAVAETIQIAKDVPAASPEQCLAWEKERLGIYLSAHPLDSVAERLEQVTSHSIAALAPQMDGQAVVLGGALKDVRPFVPRTSKDGRRMANVTLEDLSGEITVVVFADCLERYGAVIHPDRVVVVKGRLEIDRRSSAPRTRRGVEVDEGDPGQPKLVVKATSVLSLDDPGLRARNPSPAPPSAPGPAPPAAGPVFHVAPVVDAPLPEPELEEPDPEEVAPARLGMAEPAAAAPLAAPPAPPAGTEVHITVPVSAAGQWQVLNRHLSGHRGGVPVVLHIEAADGSVRDTRLPADRYGVAPGPDLCRAVTSMLGPDSYALRPPAVAAEMAAPVELVATVPSAPVPSRPPAVSPGGPPVLPISLSRTRPPRPSMEGGSLGLR
jgi:DNA polymerase-3 subunit alpha